MDEHRKIELRMAPEVREQMEERRILVEDLQKVIYHAETNGRKLVHPHTGHFKASFRPYETTFWVEYEPDGGGYVVHKAYSHRIVVNEGVPS